MKKTPPTTSWAAALQAEIANPKDEFGPGWKTLVEIQSELKASGLPSGRCFVSQWLSGLQEAGRCDMRHGATMTSRGRKVRTVKYFLK